MAKPIADANASAVMGEPGSDSNSTTLTSAPCTRRSSLAAGIVPSPDAPTSYIDWASLMRRVHLEDVLACACGGRRRILADVTDRQVVVAILEHLGLPTQAPAVARARDPTFDAA